MSEVNQAFLRAYLKNRTSQMQEDVAPEANLQGAASNPGASVSTQARQVPIATTIRQSPHLPRPSDLAATARNMAGSKTEQPMRSQQAGEHLRMDPNHGYPRSQPASDPTQAAPAPPSSQPMRGGVWSPLGVERGMKAMESSKASPAVVRNGVEAVSSQAAQQRKAQIPNAPAPIPAPHIDPQRVSNVSSQFNSIQYVDGLRGHVGTVPSAGARSSTQTLSEISQPIAFGTGLASDELSTPSFSPAEQRASAASNQTATHPGTTTPRREKLPPREQDGRGGRVVDGPVFRRFDHAHSAPPASPAIPTTEPNSSPAIEPILAPATLAPATPAPAIAVPAQTVSVAPVLESPNPLPMESPRGQEHLGNTVQAKTAQLQATAPTALPLPVAFTPSWEVDCFLWPDVVKQIEQSHSDVFNQIGKHLSTANRDGLKVMAITSGERGVGRSTVAMHMARCAAASGLKVALVDGDVFCPSLIDQLRLDVEYGWADCLFENVPLHETAIHSIRDGITLFPLTSVISAQELHANLHRVAKLIKRISTLFDIVFIDANRLNLEQRDMAGVSQESIVGAAIVVVDTELSIKEKVDTAVGILQSMGLSSIGLVENFQS